MRENTMGAESILFHYDFNAVVYVFVILPVYDNTVNPYEIQIIAIQIISHNVKLQSKYISRNQDE